MRVPTTMELKQGSATAELLVEVVLLPTWLLLLIFFASLAFAAADAAEEAASLASAAQGLGFLEKKLNSVPCFKLLDISSMLSVSTITDGTLLTLGRHFVLQQKLGRQADRVNVEELQLQQCFSRGAKLPFCAFSSLV